MDSNPNDPNPAAPQADYIPPMPPPVQTTSGLTDNVAGALAYVTIIPAIIFIVTEPYNRNPFIRFHSFQSIGLFVAWVVCWVIETFILVIPIIGFVISMLIGLSLFAIWCFTVFKAYQGEWFKLPIIGDFAMGQAKA